MILLLLPAALVTAQVEKQRPVVSGEYNKTQMQQMSEYYLNYYARINQQSAAQAYGYNGLFGSRGYLHTYVLKDKFGVSTMYSHRLRRDLFLTGELGYYRITRQGEYPASIDLFDDSGDYASSMIYPVYVGIRRGFQPQHTSRLYPYVGAGGGVAFGVGYINNRYVPANDSWIRHNYNFALAPSAYIVAGLELYTVKRVFIDLNVRLRTMKFNETVGNWKDFSGMSVGFAFAYGFGGMQLLR